MVHGLSWVYSEVYNLGYWYMQRYSLQELIQWVNLDFSETKPQQLGWVA